MTTTGKKINMDLHSDRAKYVEQELTQLKLWQAQCSDANIWRSDERAKAVAAHLKRHVPSSHTLEEKMMANLCMHIAAS